MPIILTEKGLKAHPVYIWGEKKGEKKGRVRDIWKILDAFPS